MEEKNIMDIPGISLEQKKALMEKVSSMPLDQAEKFKKKLASMSQEEIKRIIQTMQNLSPEERQKMKEQIKDMTPDQKAQMSQQAEMQREMQEKLQQVGVPGNSGGPGGVRGPGGAKAKNFGTSFRRLLQYVGSFKGSIFAAILFAVLATACSILTPYMLSRCLNTIQNRLLNQREINFRRIGWFLVILGSLYILNMLFSLIQNTLMTSVTQKTLLKMRKDVAGKMMRIPLNYYDKNAKGDVLSRITNDIDTIGTSLQQVITQTISNFIMIVGSIAFMFYYNIWLTLLCILTIPLSIFSTKTVLKKSQGHFRNQMKSMGALNGQVEETFSGMNVIKCFGYEAKALEKFQSTNDNLYEASRQAQFLSSTMNPISTAFNNLAYTLICGIGGFLVINGSLSLGGITALIQYQRQYSTPISQLTNLLNTLQSAVASSERVFELLDEAEETEIAGAESFQTSVKGDVTFEHLQFGYSPEKLLMNDIEVEVKAGQMVAIVGPTGAGKTTLINLLLRFYDVNGGRILIDGRDIRSMTRKELRSNFGMVLQETWLFNGSIRDNVCYGRENATWEELLETAKSSQIDFFVSTMPEGYDTVINEEGSNISQGQKQLLTIARAMIADPRILILDEATSSVDTRTEIMIQKAMSKLMEGKTSFVIAHRLSTIKDADLILVMKAGNIIEQGTHESLLEENGLYAQLYNSQFAHAQA